MTLATGRGQRTVFELIFDLRGGLQNLSYRHLNFLLYQEVEPLERVLNICPPE